MFFALFLYSERVMISLTYNVFIHINFQFYIYIKYKSVVLT